ncbi:hypothetical protein [Kaarinaea lacus]
MLKNFTALSILVFITSCLLPGCDQLSTDSSAPAPTITAQGFDIALAQEGRVGQFGSLRLRIESPGRVGGLQIKERSYHVDLASTPERNHFKLFGIERKPLHSQDVTLDFQNYVNQKLQAAGDYTILVEVTDKREQVTRANILIRLSEPAPAAEPPQPETSQSDIETGPSTSAQEKSESAPVKVGQFEIQRIGPREIEGEKVFGLTWKTVDAMYVTIRVRKDEEGATKLASLSISDYEKVVTVNNLSQLLDSTHDQTYVEFSTANNTGADKVLGVINQGKPYIVKTSQSTTVLSSLGTTVTLSGEYKYQ